MLNRSFYVRLPERDGDRGCVVTVSDEPWKGDLSVTGPEAVTCLRLLQAAERKSGLPCTIAETARLIIRELCPEDRTALSFLAEQADGTGEPAAAFSGGAERLLREPEYLSAYVKSQYPLFGFGIWGLFLKETGELAGLAGFSAEETEVPELGYLVDKRFRRQGLCSEALRCLGRYAEEELGFSELLIRVRRDNAAGKRATERFRRELSASGTDLRVSVCLI